MTSAPVSKQKIHNGVNPRSSKCTVQTRSSNIKRDRAINSVPPEIDRFLIMSTMPIRLVITKNMAKSILPVEINSSISGPPLYRIEIIIAQQGKKVNIKKNHISENIEKIRILYYNIKRL